MLKLLTSALLCHMILAIASYSLQRREWVKEDMGAYLEVCLQAPLELSIVLDASSSISVEDFEKGRGFLQDFISQYRIGNGPDEGVRVSIITYGLGVYPEDAFNLTTYDNKKDVVAAVGNIPHRQGPYTDTGLAIEFMRRYQLSRAVSRPGVDRICIVITDGNSQRWRKTKEEAELAREDGIIMYAIGVGKGIRDTELLNIAGIPDKVVKVENYAELQNIKENLARQTCVIKEKPTTLPPLKCGEANPADIYFVFSPSGLGEEGTDWTTSFISEVISAEDMEIGFRYGVITDTCPEALGFDLDDYLNIEDIRTRLDTFQCQDLPASADQLTIDSYTDARGGRPNANRMAVLIANNGNNDNLFVKAAVLQEYGIAVFLAGPYMAGVDIPGAVSLTGQSSREQAQSLVTSLCPA